MKITGLLSLFSLNNRIEEDDIMKGVFKTPEIRK